MLAGKRLFAARCAESAVRVLRRDRFVYGLIALYTACSVVLVSAGGLDAGSAYRQYLAVWSFVFLYLFPVLLFLLLVLAIVHRTERRRGLAFRAVFSANRIGHALGGTLLLGALMLFHGSFTGIKNALPVWHGGFPYDTALADWDRWLHFGRDPWQWLAPLGANRFLLALVEWNYEQGWFVLGFGVLFCVAVLPQAAGVRSRYMLTYCLVWITVGNLLAGLLLSTGPAFYGQATGDHARFAGLIALLHGDPMPRFSATSLQAYLWGLHATKMSGLGSGIAAFPSMHVALATLNALFLREWKPRLGFFGFAYAGFVAVSSVLLGWHYAVDAYAGAGAAALIFFAVKFGLERSFALAPAKRRVLPAFAPATAS